MCTHDLWSRAVDEVPVVDVRRVLHVQPEDYIALVGPPAFVRVDEHDQREQSRLVIRIVQQRNDVVELQRAKLARDLPCDRNANAEKLVAGAIIARRRAKESLEELGVTRIAELPQSSSNGGERGAPVDDHPTFCRINSSDWWSPRSTAYA